MERCRCLLAPLLFAVLVIVHLQTYLERLRENPFNGTYLDFYPHLFDGVYPQGNFNWNHLWFLRYLFIFSLAALPLLRRWKTAEGRSMSPRFA